jgi:methylated-DNA-[protein]-cysteine S-methyltransferase
MTETAEFALFDTALGRCAVVAGPAGLLGVLLPSSEERVMRGRIAKLYPYAVERAPRGPVADAVVRIQELLALGEADLSPIVLDFARIGPFEAQVYEIAREVPPGRTITYGEIARRIGDVAESRRVGQALGRNPWPIVVPCHRVLGADGKAGGFSAPGGVDTKLRMLALERARTTDEPSLFDDLPLTIKPRF